MIYVATRLPSANSLTPSDTILTKAIARIARAVKAFSPAKAA